MLVAGSLQQHKIPQLALAMQYVKTVNPWVQALAASSTQPDPDVASDPGLGIDGQEVVAAETNNGSSGALCEETKTPLEGAPLKSLLWGAKISGTNVKGVKWDEYLAKGGDIGNTIFVNASGKETIGVYKITESHVCFSYGTVAKWNCKTVSACISGEAPWVITDLEGKQTSLVQYVEPYGFAPYHTSRWADLASKQQLAIPHETKPRQYTPIPPDMEATALELERLFSGPSLTSNVDQNSCQITITYKSPIAGNRDFTSGGWEWWLGSNTSGQNTVGVETQIYSVDLENYDTASSRQASALGNTTLNPIFGRSFFLRSIIQRTDNQTLNSDKSQAIGGFFFKGLNAQRISQLLQELSDVCAGRVKTFAQQAEVSKMPPQPERSTESHHCSSVDNDIARLQCFDAAFGD
ncbi:hypothetical protein [Ruegeria sp. HKCCSP335]|uniref:hypothetical protein n=1 Tax=Ruegeria sp. HKCCSP335 TaxID=2794833 RepID=UPI001AE2FFEA|nr:hypothetical protein [Ruegeria sp. HKCCSP335]